VTCGRCKAQFTSMKSNAPLQASQDRGRKHALLPHCFPQRERLTAQLLNGVQVPDRHDEAHRRKAKHAVTEEETYAVKMVNLASDSSGCEGSFRSCEGE
jgi:hypothetical protein